MSDTARNGPLWLSNRPTTGELQRAMTHLRDGGELEGSALWVNACLRWHMSLGAERGCGTVANNAYRRVDTIMSG
jgi:hypothetical protein